MIHDIYLDTETTGLCSVVKGTEDPGKHDVIQIAAICNEQEMEEKCQPIRWDSIAQQALDVHGYQVADLKGFQESGVACVKFRTFLANIKVSPVDRFRMIAHNMPFDYKFVRSWFMKNGFYDWESFLIPQTDCLCTQKLGNAAYKAGKLPGIEDVSAVPGKKDMKLITAAKYIKFRFDAHDALGDTLACKKFHEYLISLDSPVVTGGQSREDLAEAGREPMGTDCQDDAKDIEEAWSGDVVVKEVKGGLVL